MSFNKTTPNPLKSLHAIFIIFKYPGFRFWSI